MNINIIFYGILGIILGVSGISFMERPMNFVAIFVCVGCIDFFGGFQKN